MRISDWSSDVCSSDLRREGLLSLEDDAQGMSDPFAKKGLMLMIDGTDPEALRSILEIEIEGAAKRETETSEVFKAGSRSEERRVGEVRVSTCRSRVW